MNNNYTGWRLTDKVIIVAKKYNTTNVTESGEIIYDYQGYVVDPGNKEMLNNAQRWATWTEYGPYISGKGHEWKQVHLPLEFEFTNDNFTLELEECAESSSQGGKLSFWNCRITKDDKSFLIGIAANLLIDVLKYNTFINGKCTSSLMFARCNGNVGMLSTNMPGYQQALKDAELRKQVNKGKTSKVILGHVYETLTLKNVYLGTFYSWYEPVYEKFPRGYVRQVVGFKRRLKPEPVYFYPSYEADKSKLSDYKSHYWYIDKNKPPARKESNDTVELDIPLQEVIDFLEYDAIIMRANKAKAQPGSNCWIDSIYVGLSVDKEKYIMPGDVREALNSLNYFVEGD